MSRKKKPSLDARFVIFNRAVVKAIQHPADIVRYFSSMFGYGDTFPVLGWSSPELCFVLRVVYVNSIQFHGSCRITVWQFAVC